MKKSSVVFLIDIQNGFARFDLSPAQGGSLYVPGGEAVGEPAGRLIRSLSDSVIVLSQDFHPAGHISFMTSHPGVMEMRKARLRQQGVAGADLDAAVLSPLQSPFDDILLAPDAKGRFRAIACGVGKKWCAVETNVQGCITTILDRQISAHEAAGALRQKLWSPHCEQGTESALFDPAVMAELPPDLIASLHNDRASPILEAKDERGNVFYVVRKGMRPDLDSYGIATENDGLSKTEAPKVFAKIAAYLKEKGVELVDSYIGGLAENFCVEFSDNDLHAGFLPMLDTLHIDCNAHLLTDITRGIPILVRSGAWPDLAHSQRRMLAKGKCADTAQDVMRAQMYYRMQAQKPKLTP